MPNFCPNCGAELKFPNAEICPACGVRIRDPPLPEKRKFTDPVVILAVIACIVSLIAVALILFVVFPDQDSYQQTSSVTHPAQFINPGFETGNSAGWTVGKTTAVQREYSHRGLYSCHFDMTGTQSTDYLSQSIDLTGAKEISFWGWGESNTWPFSIYIDGNLVQTSAALSNTWVQYTVPVSGYSGTHTFSVKWNGGPGLYGADVDDFEVT